VEGGRENGPCVGPDAEEGAVAEGDLSGEADQDVETDRGDRRNPDHVEDIHHIGTGQQRHEGEQDHQTDPGPETAEIGREDRELPVIAFAEIPAGVQMDFSHVFRPVLSPSARRDRKA
jgi:hypothetical protein